MWEASQLYGVYQEDALHLINTQIGTANYLLRPQVPQPGLPDEVASTNEELWRNVLPSKEAYRAGMTLTLERFLLFEWLPRAPGLYFTSEGKHARKLAQGFLRQVPVPRPSGTAQLDSRIKDREFLDVYDPYGKIAMLKGGVGCIRLRPKMLEGGMFWFLSASSTGVAHEGFPVALPDSMFQRHIDRIKNKGALRCTLRGKLQFVPDAVAELYREIRRVPQLYMQVEELIPSSDHHADSQLVSVGISFLSEFEGLRKMYASYATFDSGQSGSLDETVDWLDEVYVQGLYGGHVITDFDEQMTRFSGATFSLRNIMENHLDLQQVQTVIQTVNLYQADTGRLFAGLTSINHLHVERIDRMEQNKSINIGSGASVSAPVVIADEIQRSFNTLRDSNADPDLKGLLEKLLKEVQEAAQATRSPEGENAARDSRNLVEEATASMPRAGESARLGTRVLAWAKTIGEAGKPVVELITAILPLLPH
jgi:hypothetical protein